ncbi:GNAT family N-acetyltransferase [Sporosarcina sp. ACRSM]|uniref:GNAT family N-acetyltransferase n=1 Tax=Sporosarcina sp. ACRSM TaxID=2918216 RepID=UPI001EF694EB|nr:GNAT family N-acetyltransferase [Sporosarcina sp. ACRSM]MCG7336910.1 GNAT family N-acetyltransferase [Sporosarcina sp. ACRSM]
MNAKRITTNSDLERAFHIRKEVFVEEQGVPLEDEFDEFDTLDGRCEHVLVYHDEEAVGTGRLRVVDGSGKLERICILKPYRQYGLGKRIIQTLEEIAAEKGIARVKLHGQTHAENFYKKLGYETASEMFMEDGIPHILMTKELTKQ